jgi:dihydroflavonol-4-reductase
VAAVFKHWAKDPEAEIVIPNVNGTRIVLEAAAQAGVRKVVYVSSVAAIGHDGQPLDESHWNPDLSNPYYRSKILSELHAWQVAQQHGLWMVSILPSAMIGPNAQQLTDTMGFLESIRRRQLPVNPNFHFNFIDVRDVAEGAILAAEKGQAGQRYILANTHSSDLGALIDAANSLPRSYTTPPTAPKWLLLAAAWCNELLARVSGNSAKLTRSQVRLFHGVKQEYQTGKTQSQLGFQPRSPALALEEAFAYLERRAS